MWRGIALQQWIKGNVLYCTSLTGVEDMFLEVLLKSEFNLKLCIATWESSIWFADIPRKSLYYYQMLLLQYLLLWLPGPGRNVKSGIQLSTPISGINKFWKQNPLVRDFFLRSREMVAVVALLLVCWVTCFLILVYINVNLASNIFYLIWRKSGIQTYSWLTTYSKLEVIVLVYLK